MAQCQISTARTALLHHLLSEIRISYMYTWYVMLVNLSCELETSLVGRCTVKPPTLNNNNNILLYFFRMQQTWNQWNERWKVLFVTKKNFGLISNPGGNGGGNFTHLCSLAVTFHSYRNTTICNCLTLYLIKYFRCFFRVLKNQTQELCFYLHFIFHAFRQLFPLHRWKCTISKYFFLNTFNNLLIETRGLHCKLLCTLQSEPQTYTNRY